jgi:hypothetical protein
MMAITAKMGGQMKEQFRDGRTTKFLFLCFPGVKEGPQKATKETKNPPLWRIVSWTPSGFA